MPGPSVCPDISREPGFPLYKSPPPRYDNFQDCRYNAAGSRRPSGKETAMQNLTVTSPAFQDGGWIPLDNSARGSDLSPELRLQGISERAVSLAVTMDDADHPIFSNFNHWILWNLPVREVIPAALPAGSPVPGLPGAVQGVAYGKNRYKGPKPPLKAIHTYRFTVYVLDCRLSLPPSARRKDFLPAIEGHVLQKATLCGKFQSRRQGINRSDK